MADLLRALGRSARPAYQYSRQLEGVLTAVDAQVAHGPPSQRHGGKHREAEGDDSDLYYETLIAGLDTLIDVQRRARERRSGRV